MDINLIKDSGKHPPCHVLLIQYQSFLDSYNGVFDIKSAVNNKLFCHKPVQ